MTTPIERDSWDVSSSGAAAAHRELAWKPETPAEGAPGGWRRLPA